MNGKLFLIAAPSGAGKTTLVNELLTSFKDIYNIHRVITYTSRHPRGNEVTGQDYHFISSIEFEAKIEEGFFLEWSNVYSSYYGTPKNIINELEKGKSYFLIIDRFGVKQILEKFPYALSIWIQPPSLEILEQRLLQRNTESLEKISKRLAIAAQELEIENIEPICTYCIVNDCKKLATDQLKQIVFKELGLSSF
ncbi:guanylate kinase [Candidatus Dependentiae bacterium]|nr:guanylate kinase [Candidatus Dependentiae bacterium]